MRHRTATEYEAGIERCLADCQRMEEIVAQMLTLARVEESSVPAENLRTDAMACIQEVLNQLATMAESRNIQLRLLCPVTPFLAVDPEQFKLLCNNILLNGMQHSAAGSTIQIEVEVHNSTVEILIMDHGDGIAPDDLPHVFDRFWRSDPSRSRKTGGTGLGLAICKAIVDRHHGTISIKSEPNVGTSVTVQFPIVESIPEPEKANTV
jgi:signal transduction histidine kinase